MVLDGVISIGFVRQLDLTPIVGKPYLAAQSWVEAQVPHESGIAKNTLARFAAMQPGDVVALKSHSAPQGSQARLVIARYAVVAGSSRVIYAQSQLLGHTLKVDFLNEQELIEFSFGYGQTLHAIKDPARIASIFGRYAESARQVAHETVATKAKATHSSEIMARGAYLMQRVHNALQNQLREFLVAHYGHAAVKQEENFVDLAVRLTHKTLLFEVKSSPSPVACIREALGQLLQYSWKQGLQGEAVQYVIVGPSPPGKEDIEYLDHVAAETGIALIYCTPKTFTPSDA